MRSARCVEQLTVWLPRASERLSLFDELRKALWSLSRPFLFVPRTRPAQRTASISFFRGLGYFRVRADSILRQASDNFEGLGERQSATKAC